MTVGPRGPLVADAKVKRWVELPDLRAAQRALASASSGAVREGDASDAGRLPAAPADEADRITDSANTITAVLRRKPDADKRGVTSGN